MRTATKKKLPPKSRRKSAPAPVDAMSIEAFIQATGEPREYVLAYFEKGWLDEALVPGDRTRHIEPAICPSGLARFMLIDEVACLIAHGKLSPEDAATVTDELLPKVDGLWHRIRAGKPVTIRLAKPNDPKFQIEMSFLQRAADRRRQVITAPEAALSTK
jgi:hypothetical protein